MFEDNTVRRAVSRVRLEVRVEGIVQGVGFRPFVYALAARLGLAGNVRMRCGGRWLWERSSLGAVIVYQTGSDILRYVQIKRIARHPELVPAAGTKGYPQSRRDAARDGRGTSSRPIAEARPSRRSRETTRVDVY
jgi:hypothetical protein